MTPCKHCGAVPRYESHGTYSVEHKYPCPLYDEESAQIIAPNEIDTVQHTEKIYQLISSRISESEKFGVYVANTPRSDFLLRNYETCPHCDEYIEDGEEYCSLCRRAL